VSDMAKVTIDH